MTVQEAGRASMQNGVLLQAANASFDVLVTADKNLHYQQNFTGLNIAVLVLPSNRAKMVRGGVLALVQSLPHVRPGEKAVMDLAAAPNWGVATLAEVVVEHGIARHVCRP